MRLAARVDSRSIADLKPADLVGYTRCHFFAGIGGWELALRWAGWPDDRPVWTGSCPCQPFSSAGKQRGTADERHLWPAFRELIAECRPPTIFGEQVASKAGREWLAGVRADLEALGYAVGAADLCAAGIGAPHIRQRLFWVADAEGGDREVLLQRRGPQQGGVEPQGGGGACGGLADASSKSVWRQRGGGVCSAGTAGGGPEVCERERGGGDAPPCCQDSHGLGDTVRTRSRGHAGHGVSCHEPRRLDAAADGSTAPPGWDDFILVKCVEPTRDGGTQAKWRRASAEPEAFPLAHGLPGRVGVLRGAGNAIVPELAAAFIRAYLETEG
ncbi:MAG: DNA cytosine methyltransferase [Planctomycetota bacterium]